MMNEEQLSLILQNQARMEGQIKTLFNQQEDNKRLTESVHELAASVKLLASAQKTTEKKVDDLTTDVETIKEKPAKRWDNAVWLIVTAILTAVVTYFLTKLGLK